LPANLLATVVPPAGLAPGSQYQIIFVTFETTTGVSSDIGDYNKLVNDEAAFATAFGLPAGIHWNAVVSTPTVNAKDNAPSNGLPVYNTGGQLVSSTGIYSGSLLSPVFYDSIGQGYGIQNSAVWTGSTPAGIGVPGETLGGLGFSAIVGSPSDTTDVWMDGTIAPRSANSWAIFALSDPITVPIPEPATLTLLAWRSSRSAACAFCGGDARRDVQVFLVII
jgi:hypothetical protein